MDKNNVTGIDNLIGFQTTQNEDYYKVEPNIYNKVKLNK